MPFSLNAIFKQLHWLPASGGTDSISLPKLWKLSVLTTHQQISGLIFSSIKRLGICTIALLSYSLSFSFVPSLSSACELSAHSLQLYGTHYWLRVACSLRRPTLTTFRWTPSVLLNHCSWTQVGRIHVSDLVQSRNFPIWTGRVESVVKIS